MNVKKICKSTLYIFSDLDVVKHIRFPFKRKLSTQTSKFVNNSELQIITIPIIINTFTRYSLHYNRETVKKK